MTDDGVLKPTRERDPLLGRMLGDYRLESLLATGGMSRIYRAEDVNLGRQVAIKVLSHHNLDEDDTLARRFQREARELAHLEHPNIITIFKYGEQDGYNFLAMKLIKGHDLAQEMKRRKQSREKLDIPRTLRILAQVAQALDYAHANGVIHRDVKPSNVLITDEDQAILTDFGLVMRSSALTTMGTAFGTPRYIAPEQASSSNRAVPQSDIYSLAVMLYELLAGEPPFKGDTPMEIALSHISDAPPPPRSKNPEIPVSVEREILKALSKTPTERHSAASEFIDAVTRAYHLPVTNAPVPIKTVVAPTPVPTVADGKTERKIAARAPKQARAPWRGLLTLLAALAAIAIIAALLASTLQRLRTVEVLLIYDDSHFTVVNTSSSTLGTLQTDFVRGVTGDRDDFPGDRIPGDEVGPQSCFRISLQNVNYSPPPQCQEFQVKMGEFLLEPLLLFWRQETPNDTRIANFSVIYEGQGLQTCPTVARGEIQECVVEWPVIP